MPSPLLTALRTYPRYAAGGGYVLSADLVAALAQAERTVGLKRTSAEVRARAWLASSRCLALARSGLAAWGRQARGDAACASSPCRRFHFPAA